MKRQFHSIVLLYLVCCLVSTASAQPAPNYRIRAVYMDGALFAVYKYNRNKTLRYFMNYFPCEERVCTKRTVLYYDPFGILIAARESLSNGKLKTQVDEYIFKYDERGRPSKISVYTWDERGQTVLREQTVFQYQGTSNLPSKELVFNGGLGLEYEYRYTYESDYSAGAVEVYDFNNNLLSASEFAYEQGKKPHHENIPWFLRDLLCNKCLAPMLMVFTSTLKSEPFDQFTHFDTTYDRFGYPLRTTIVDGDQKWELTFLVTI